jgi:putative sterol carrier protein
MSDEYLFLSPEWVHEVTRVVQSARTTDKDFGKLAQSFSVSLVYFITELPSVLREQYKGSQLTVLVQLDKGTVKKLCLGTEVPQGKNDFIVSSSYGVARQIFQGQANPATVFIDRRIKVEPMRRVYQRPRFTAKAIVTGNALLKIARRVLTVYAQDVCRVPTGA